MSPATAGAGMAGLGLAACIAALLTHRRRPWLPEDAPGAGRKQHEKITPMVGLVPALASATLGLAFSLPWPWTLAVLVSAAVGWCDDVTKHRGRDLPAAPKAVLLLGAATLLAYAAAPTGDLATFAVLTTAAFACINAVNFLDNTDGVSISVGIVGFGVLAAAAETEPERTAAFALGGPWLGALPLNWPRARAFLGDCGALSLGTALTGYALVLAASSDPARAGEPSAGFGIALFVAALAIPILDFCQVVTLRLIIRHPPWIGDRRHVSHRLLQIGLPRPLVAPALALLGIGIAALVSAT